MTGASEKQQNSFDAFDKGVRVGQAQSDLQNRSASADAYNQGYEAGMARANGDRLREKVLSRGRTGDPQTMFRDFYGGPPDIEPLLDYRGLR